VDKETVKMLLASYRPQDAEDPIFADALREVARDPELAAWFEEMQRFDVVVGEKFRTASVPAEVKARVLADARTASIPAANTMPGKALVGGAAGDCSDALRGAHRVAERCTRACEPRAGVAGDLYSEEMPALQFVCFDAGEVAKWINKHPRSRHLGLKLNQPAEALSMRMIGSSVVDWKGQPVTMVCLQDGKRMAMLYILTAADAALPDGATETVEERGWTVRTIKTGGQVRVLTVKGRAEEQDFQVPF
jgi:hypothetical protein